MTYKRYLRAVRNKVCAHCVDLAEEGKCTLTGFNKCGVELYLPEIVTVVHSVESDKLGDYIQLLRKKVCSNCKNQNADGTCKLRTEADCGLDRYFALIIEAIEEVDQKRVKRR